MMMMIRKWIAGTTVALVLSACGGVEADHELESEPAQAEATQALVDSAMAPPLEFDPNGETEAADPNALRLCQLTCGRGEAAAQAFCMQLPAPPIRIACFSAMLVGGVVCLNWCAWHFGS